MTSITRQAMMAVELDSSALKNPVAFTGPHDLEGFSTGHAGETGGRVRCCGDSKFSVRPVLL